MTSLQVTPLLPNQMMLALDPTPSAAADSVPSLRKPKTRYPNSHDFRDVFNGRLLEGLTVVGPFEIPRIEPCTLVPDKLVVFSEAMSAKRPDPDAWVHFYEDDYRCERFWKAPERYLTRLSKFAGIVSPDFSLYRNMPEAVKINHTFRNQLLGAWIQAQGMNVITNVRLSGTASVPYALAGVPQHSTLSIGLHGCTKSVENRRQVFEDIQIICDQCEPLTLLVYGSDRYHVLDYPLCHEIAVRTFKPDFRYRSQERRAA